MPKPNAIRDRWEGWQPPEPVDLEDECEADATDILIAAHEPARYAYSVPMFPRGGLTPHSECPHRGERPPIPFVCMVCNRAGADGSPEFPLIGLEPTTNRSVPNASPEP